MVTLIVTSLTSSTTEASHTLLQVSPERFDSQMSLSTHFQFTIFFSYFTGTYNYNLDKYFIQFSVYDLMT